ncbi:hypothetical protein ECG_00308 [Echinococcus granulosus]|nr:hypothetical protein ECG_00308 [Echinococcus granulosus]
MVKPQITDHLFPLPHRMESTVNASSLRSPCDLTLPEFVVYFYVQPTICLIGFVLNIINCQVFRKPDFVGPEYKMMIALSVTDAITLLCTFPLGFQRCKGFLEACLKPWFKSFRLGISYYTAYVQFPVSNASETASIFLTLLLSIERYVAMHKISCPGMWRPKCRLHNLLCHQTKSHRLNFKCHLTRLRLPCCSGCHHCFNSIILSFQRLFSIFNDNVLVTIIKYPADNTTTSVEDSFSVKWRVDVTDFGKSQSYAVYTWLRTIFVHVIPLLLLCVINFYLIKFIRIANARWRISRRAHKTKNHPPDLLTAEPQDHLHSKEEGLVTSAATLAANRRNERRQAAQRKLTVLLVAIVGLFLAGQIPQAFAYVSNAQVVLRLFGWSSQPLSCCPPYRLYRAITNCICLITYSANFFLYASLNSHFKHQLGKWIGKCNLRRQQTPRLQPITATESDKYDTIERVKHRLQLKETVSADEYQVKRRRTPRKAALNSVSNEVPVTDPIAVSDVSDRVSFYSHSDHVWRVSIAVLPQAGGRPVALANATMGRSVTATQSHSSSPRGSVKAPRHAISLPTNHMSVSSDLIIPNSFSEAQPSHPAPLRRSNQSVFNSQPLLKQAKEDLSTAPDEKILVRMHSHSKHFWSKRRRQLAETRKCVKFKKTGHPVESETFLNENRFHLNVTSQRFPGIGHQCRDRSNLQLSLPSYLANMSWCPPFIVASLLRANRSLKDTINPHLRNTIPIAYQETHLDNIL